MHSYHNRFSSYFDLRAFVFFQCIRNVYTSKIISSDRDLLGVVFYGTEKNKNLADFKHVYVLQELDNPGKDSKVI